MKETLMQVCARGSTLLPNMGRTQAQHAMEEALFKLGQETEFLQS